MSKLCQHDADLTNMKLRKYGRTKYYGPTPLKILSFDNLLTRCSKMDDRIIW